MPTRDRNRPDRPAWTERFAAVALVMVLSIAACCGSGDDDTQGSATQGSAGEQAAANTAEGTEGVERSTAVPAPPTGAIDGSLAADGERLFKERGCVACHTVGAGKLVGPDLLGVTERREYEWIYRMITNPDSMLANDETARQMLGEYFTPMPNQNVQPDEARALYEYLRSVTEEEAAAAGSTEAASTSVLLGMHCGMNRRGDDERQEMAYARHHVGDGAGCVGPDVRMRRPGDGSSERGHRRHRRSTGT